MRYSVNLSFVMDDQDKAKQLMAHLYTLCLQPALWSLKGHLQSEYSVIMTHAELEALPFGKSIDPVQLPSSIKVLDGNGQIREVGFSAVDGECGYYGSQMVGMQVAIPLNDGVQL